MEGLFKSFDDWNGATWERGRKRLYKAEIGDVRIGSRLLEALNDGYKAALARQSTSN